MHTLNLLDLRAYATDIQTGCHALSLIAKNMATLTPAGLPRAQWIVFAQALELAADKASLITDLTHTQENAS